MTKKFREYCQKTGRPEKEIRIKKIVYNFLFSDKKINEETLEQIEQHLTNWANNEGQKMVKRCGGLDKFMECLRKNYNSYNGEIITSFEDLEEVIK
jgi:hypothetical protein